MSRLGRNLRFMGAGTIGVALLQYALYFLAARYLGTEGYGDLAIALTMALLAAPLCDLGMNVSTVWIHTHSPERLPEVLGTSSLIRLALALPVCGIALLIGVALGFDDRVLLLFGPLFFAAVLDGLSGLCSAMFQAREQMGYSATIMLVRNAGKAIAFLLVLTLGGDQWSLVLGFLAASVACTLWCGSLTLRHTAIRFDWTEVRPVLATAWPFGSAIIANLLLLQSDILMLGYFAGEEQVGVYHAAFRFLVLAELVPHIVSNVVMPRSYRLGHRDGSAGVTQFYRLQAVALGTLGVLGSLVLAQHGPMLAAWCLGPDFAASGELLIALSPLLFMRYMIVPLGDALASLGQQAALSRSTWVAFTVNALLNLCLIPALGVVGAAVATAVSQLVMLILVTTASCRYGLRPHWHRTLCHAAAAAAVAATLGLLLPGSIIVVPLGVLCLAVLFRFAPSQEHLELSDSSPLLRWLRPRTPQASRSA